MSGVAQYPEDDNFQQSEPVGITIGSNDCTVDIYNIRVYDNNLTQYQSLDNYMADIDDYDKKVTIYNKNQVYNAYGDISYDATLNLVPGLIIIGELPQYKGDKKTVTLLYTDKQHPERSFIAYNVQIDVQGTSSQYYPRKNYKFKFKSGLTMLESGEEKEAYPLRPDSIPATAFCTKADFAESSGTHNTGMAVIIDKLLKDMGILTPPQKENNKVRTTIDGFPICIFHRVADDSDIEFVGKYNFNYDKSAENTFGFAEGDESWEFCNNTSDRVLFKSADFSGTDWMNDFEARYPDDDVINGEYEAGTRKPVNLMEVAEWVVSTKDDADKFKAEVTDHFDLNNLLAYYLITEIFAMVDQRAKNMFLTRFHGDNKWRFIFYDNDTCFGINNEGLIAFSFNVEYHDKLGAQDVFNGESSVLWKNVEACFPAEIEAMYKDIRSKGYLSYSYVMSVLNGEQSDKWCEAIYNADGRFKYIDPLINEGNGSYLYAAQGSREEHRKWWTYNRFLYMDSKYTAGDFLSDFATLRLYTPANWGGVAPSANFTMIPFANSYVRVKYGSYIVGQRCEKDAVVNILAPAIQFNDTETIVYGASRIKSLGDLSGMYAGSVDVSKATRLSELIIGSSAEGYHNDNLTVLAVGSNKMLRKLDIRNCPNLKQAVDLSGCENIEEVYAQGTAITSVVLPAAGILSKLYLPATLTNLTLKNQPKLSDAFFEIAGVEKLSTIISENTNGVNIFPVVDRCLSAKNPALSRVRLIDLNATGANLDILYKLIKLGGVDEKGNNVATAVVTGKYHAVTAVEDKLAAIRAAFPELTVTYTTLKAPTVTTFTFSSSQNKTITNSTFECNFEAVKVDERTYKVTADDDSVIDFTFKCDNHEDYSDTYLVSGTRSQSYSVTYIPLRKIRVKVYNQNLYIENARVIIGNDVYVTDTDGYATLKRGGEAVSGTVEAAGYAGNTFSFAAITNDTTHSVEIYAAVEVKFIVKSNKDLLVGATISCDGKEAVSNQYGECTLLLGKGDHEYTFSHPDYIDDTRTITVGTSDMTVNVYAPTMINFTIMNEAGYRLKNAIITCIGNEYTTDENGNCSIMAPANKGFSYTIKHPQYMDLSGANSTSYGDIGLSLKLLIDVDQYKPSTTENIRLLLLTSDGKPKITVTSKSTDYKIHWPDGTIINAIGTGSQSYTKENTPIGLIEISECEQVTNLSYSAGALIAYYSIGNSLLSNFKFQNKGSIRYLPSDIFKNDINRKNFDQALDSCGSLSVDFFGAFDNLPNANSFYRTFCYNYQIEKLPPLWEMYYDKAISTYWCFMGCEKASNYSEVPASWGGRASEWYPTFDADVKIKIFKDGAWWLNQQVTFNGIIATQMVDGTYSASLTELRHGNTITVSINGSLQGEISIVQTRVNYVLLIGNSSGLIEHTILDFTTGDTHEDLILFNESWKYSESIGGLISRAVGYQKTTTFEIIVFEGPVTIIYGQRSSNVEAYNYCTIYNGNTALKALNSSDYIGDDLSITVDSSGNLKFTVKQGNQYNSVGDVLFWIKSIECNTLVFPELPADFVPASPAVSGVVMADYRAINARLKNVENALGFND